MHEEIIERIERDVTRYEKQLNELQSQVPQTPKD